MMFRILILIAVVIVAVVPAAPAFADNDGRNPHPADTLVGGTNPNKRDPHFGLLLSKNGPTADCSAAGATIVFPRFTQAFQQQINATPKKLRAALIANAPPSAFFPPIVQGTGPTAIVLGFDYRNGGHCG